MSDGATSQLDPARLQAELDSARAALATEQNLRAHTELRLRSTGAQLSTEQTERVRAQQAQIDNAIAAGQNEITALKQQLVAANEAGAFADAADLQTKLFSAVSRVDRYTAQKDQIAAQAAAPAGQGAGQPDPADQYGKPGSPVRTWIDHNPRFLTDSSFNARAMRGHHAALAQGIQPETPEYFKLVEDAAYERQAEQPRRRVHDGDDLAGLVELADTGYRRPEAELPPVIPANPRAVQPQPRAAGNGTSLASVAAAPSRHVAGSPDPSNGAPSRLSADEAQTAITLAATLRPDLRTDADKFKWYRDMQQSDAAQRLRAKWAAA
jgi:hypothetical protein